MELVLWRGSSLTVCAVALSVYLNASNQCRGGVHLAFQRLVCESGASLSNCQLTNCRSTVNKTGFGQSSFEGFSCLNQSFKLISCLDLHLMSSTVWDGIGMQLSWTSRCFAQEVRAFEKWMQMWWHWWLQNRTINWRFGYVRRWFNGTGITSPETNRCSRSDVSSMVDPSSKNPRT